jgi:hypothetical protein
MSYATRRNLARLAASGAAATVLVGGLAQGAQAATYPHLTLAKAKTALPTSKSLPGGVKLVGKVRTAPRTYGVPCPTKPAKVVLPGGSVVAADYGNGTEIDSPKYLAYNVSIVTFSTAKQATAAAGLLAKAAKACPKTATVTEGGVSEKITRTLRVKASSKAWTGYRTIDHLDISGGGASVSVREYEAYLTRGNVLVVIDEAGAVTQTNGKLQDTRRKTVTNLVIHRLSALN